MEAPAAILPPLRPTAPGPGVPLAAIVAFGAFLAYLPGLVCFARI